MGIWMAVIVTLLGSGDSSQPPQIRVSPEGFYSADACDEWKAGMQVEKPPLVDKPTGKPIAATFYHCTPIRAEVMVEDIQKALKKYQ